MSRILIRGCVTLFVATVSSSAQAVPIATVLVSDAGNPADPSPPPFFVPDPVGTVDYEFLMGQYEVTNDQYAEFLNAVAAADPTNLYATNMGGQSSGGILRSGMSGSYLYAVKPNYGNKPVSYIDFFDALRFANWLHNGQPTGPQNASTTEDGAYTLEGGTPVPTNHMAVVRNPDAEWFVPSLDEWYKAANYDPRTEIEGGPPSDDFYWRFATQSDMDPTEATANSVGDVTNPGANVANYNLGASWNGGSPYVTTVGGAGPLSASFYGTYGQAGNIEEWTDDPGGGAIQIYRIKIGGSWNAGPADQLTLAEAIHVSAANNLPSGGSNDAGFRVAKVVPEPGSLGLGMFAVGLLSLFGWMKRGKRKGTAGATGINLRGPCGWGQGEWLGSSAASLQVGVYK